MDKLKFITEDIFDVKLLEEQKNNNEPKFLKICGPYVMMNNKNGNGRVYPDSVTVPAVEQYIESYINTKGSMGELNHPKDLEVNLERVCHNVTKLERDGDYYYGESKILTGTPCGDILAGLLKNDVRIGISSRGAGKIGPNNIMEKYILKAFDIVHDPSGINCFVNGILESKEYMINSHGELIEIAYEKIENELNTLPRFTDERKVYITNAINEFIKDIKVVR